MQVDAGCLVTGGSPPLLLSPPVLRNTSSVVANITQVSEALTHMCSEKKFSGKTRSHFKVQGGWVCVTAGQRGEGGAAISRREWQTVQDMGGGEGSLVRHWLK